jgi:hypothetical protein
MRLARSPQALQARLARREHLAVESLAIHERRLPVSKTVATFLKTKNAFAQAGHV